MSSAKTGTNLPERESSKPLRGTHEKVRRWASESTPQKVMARRLGVGVTQFKKWMEEDERLQAAYDEGVESEHQMLVGALKKQLDKSPTPAIFLLKTRHGYIEGDRVEQANRVQLTINLPAAPSREDWLKAKVIEPEKLPNGD